MVNILTTVQLIFQRADKVINAEEKFVLADALPTDTLSLLMATNAGSTATPSHWVHSFHQWQQNGLSQDDWKYICLKSAAQPIHESVKEQAHV